MLSDRLYNWETLEQASGYLTSYEGVGKNHQAQIRRDVACVSSKKCQQLPRDFLGVLEKVNLNRYHG